MTEPVYTPSAELRQINDRINFLENAVRTGFSGNDDWRAKHSMVNQLETLMKKRTAVEEKSIKEYEIALLDWKLKKMEEEESARVTKEQQEEMRRIWEENPILGMEV